MEAIELLGRTHIGINMSGKKWYALLVICAKVAENGALDNDDYNTLKLLGPEMYSQFDPILSSIIMEERKREKYGERRLKDVSNGNIDNARNHQSYVAL